MGFREDYSLLKKSVLNRSWPQNRTETHPKHYKTGVLRPGTGGSEGYEGVFQHADYF